MNWPLPSPGCILNLVLRLRINLVVYIFLLLLLDLVLFTFCCVLTKLTVSMPDKLFSGICWPREIMGWVISFLARFKIDIFLAGFLTVYIDNIFFLTIHLHWDHHRFAHLYSSTVFCTFSSTEGIFTHYTVSGFTFSFRKLPFFALFLSPPIPTGEKIIEIPNQNILMLAKAREMEEKELWFIRNLYFLKTKFVVNLIHYHTN